MFVRKFQAKTLNPVQKWYNSPITTDDGFIIDNDGWKKTHGKFIETVANDISEVLEKNFYYITDNDAFFDELINIIYNVSDNS